MSLISPLPKPIYVTVIREMSAFELIELMPNPELSNPTGQVLQGSSAYRLATGPETKRRIHIVCEGTLALGIEAKYMDPYLGNIENIQNGHVSGWAIDRVNGQHGANVELLINGIPYLTQVTTIPRKDVVDCYHGYSDCGFAFNANLDNMPFETMNISVRIKDTPYEVKGRHSTYTRPKGVRRLTKAHQVHVISRPVSVIVPIYNAPQELRECLDTLLAHTALGEGKHRVILTDDASPDPAIAQVLDEYEKYSGLIILRNSRNRGYTGNINHGIIKAREIDPDGDVVLLNSDTRVTPQWLELLQRRALQNPTIGTVSAMSDNAGAFSVPVRNSANPVPPWMGEDDYARMITHISNLRDLRVPTTSGFCMYIKQALFADIGLFDTQNFPKGYGEENDFCMRAQYAGWEHAIADNVIIFHERSASFLGAKTQLMERASDLIPKMYPEYHLAVAQGFVQSDDIQQTRFDIAHTQLRYPRLSRPRVAFVIGVNSGGTPQTNMDLMSSIQTEYEPYLLFCSTGFISVFKIIGNEQHELEKIPLHHHVMPIAHDSASYRYQIVDILQRYGFEMIHIRHIGRHGLSLIRSAKDLNIPVLFSLHDFYTVCPNVKLLDAENNYCAGVCTPAGGDCTVELWDNRFTPTLKHNWIKSWRQTFQNILPLCDGLITTSPYARALIQSIYDIDDISFDVIPHARDFDGFDQLSAPLIQNEPLRIFLPGHIVAAKGLDLVKDIKAIDVDNRIEFHFAGLSKADLSQYGVYHGAYKREEFALLVEKIKPHIGAVLSIWPETYSHTLTELWSCGVPVITSHYGATGERVGDHGGGWAFEDMSAQYIYDFLVKIADNPADIDTKRTQILKWQEGYGNDYNVAIMAERYKRLYHQTLHRTPVPQSEVIVLSLGGHSDAFVPTTHLRAVLTGDTGQSLGLQRGREGYHIMTWPASTLYLFDMVDLPDVLIIRYHGEPADAERILKDLPALRARSADMKLLVEVTCDTFTAPMQDRDKAGFTNNRAVLDWLLINADCIIGPAEHIKEAPLPAPINLDVMVPDPAHHGRLPTINTPDVPAHLDTSSVSYEAHIAERLNAEVVAGASAHIYRHNAPFVAANFTLIDWDAMLSRPRIPGLVSLVIPTFNRVGLTEKFLRSIVDLTEGGTAFEIIVIDNGSKPEVRVQIEALAALDPRIKVVCAMVPLMFAVGCNYGASFARGEYILFLNNDMEVIEPHWLDALMAPLTDSAHVGMVGGRLLFGDRTVQHAGLEFSNESDLAYHVYLGDRADAEHVMKSREVTALTGACMAMRATDWAKLRGFNPLF